MKIKSTRMTKENFADYGRFISRHNQTREAGNDYAYTGNLAHIDLDTATVGHLTAYAHAPKYDSLERHKDTAEMLVILSGGGTILFAKPGDDSNDGLVALEVKKGDTIVMKPSTWHGLMTPINCDSVDIIVVFKKGTEDNDLIFQDLDEAVEIEI
jgi:ureidoglycolate hydrolase